MDIIFRQKQSILPDKSDENFVRHTFFFIRTS